jgi:hypothetical protein
MLICKLELSPASFGREHLRELDKLLGIRAFAGQLHENMC